MRKPGRPPAAERVVPDPSPDVGPSNAGTSGRAPSFLGQDLPHKQHDKAAIVDPSKNLFGLRILENNWSSEHKSERNDDFSGQFSIIISAVPKGGVLNCFLVLSSKLRVILSSRIPTQYNFLLFLVAFGLKGGWSKWGKKLSEIDDSRRSTYDHPIPSDSMQEPPIFATFDGDRKVLIPVSIFYYLLFLPFLFLCLGIVDCFAF